MLVVVKPHHEDAGGSGLSDHGGDGHGNEDAAGNAGHDQGHLHPLHLDPPGLGALIEDSLHLQSDRLTV